MVQAGGGIHGHPEGTHAGAKALRAAAEAYVEDVSLEEYAKDHQELATAIQKWGTETPR